MNNNLEGKTVMVNIRPTNMAKVYEYQGIITEVWEDECYVEFASNPVLNGYFKNHDIAIVLGT